MIPKIHAKIHPASKRPGGESGFSHQVESFGPPGVDNLGLVETRSLKMQRGEWFYDLENSRFGSMDVWYIYYVNLYLRYFMVSMYAGKSTIHGNGCCGYWINFIPNKKHPWKSMAGSPTCIHPRRLTQNLRIRTPLEVRNIIWTKTSWIMTSRFQPFILWGRFLDVSPRLSVWNRWSSSGSRFRWKEPWESLEGLLLWSIEQAGWWSAV